MTAHFRCELELRKRKRFLIETNKLINLIGV